MTIIPLTCFVCNSPMRRYKSSAPQGEAACRPCRKSGKALKHGTSYAYGDCGCRCDACREGHRVRLAAYVAKVKARDGVSPSAALKRKARGTDPNASWDCVVCGLPLVNAARGTDNPIHKACKPTGEWIDPALRLELYERDQFTCWLCSDRLDPSADPSGPKSLTLDHVIPRSRGGSHDPSNLMTACRSCNSRKGAKVLTA